MKHSRIFIGLLLILALLVVSCDDQTNMLADTERALVASYGLEMMMAAADFIDYDGAIADDLPDGLAIANIGGTDDKKLTWNNFDLYDYFLLKDDEFDPEDTDLPRNQLVITSGTAIFEYEENEENEFEITAISADFGISLNNIPEDNVSSGTYRIQIDGALTNDFEDIEFKVNGVKVNIEDLFSNP